MEKITINGRIEFIEEEAKRYDRDFTATLEDSPAFQYGNGTCVCISFGEMKNGHKPEGRFIDTRYDTSISKNAVDFKKWLTTWFYENYSDHNLIIQE